MANRHNATLSGLGSFGAVYNARIADLAPNEKAQMQLANAYNAIGGLLDDEQTAQSALALACAVINRTFEDRGWLVSVDGKGYLTFNFFAAPGERKPILDLMAD